jgi:hypothetical protein
MILILSVPYYLLVAFRYYRKDIVKIFAVKKITGGENLSMDFQKPMLQSFSAEVRVFLFEATKNNLDTQFD